MKIKVLIPQNCPSCNTSLTRVKDQLFCTSNDCIAMKIKKVVNFAKVMKIKGLGEKTIEKLELNDILDIYELSPNYTKEVIGEKLTTKLLSEIEKSKTNTLDVLLASFSIPLIGNTASQKISQITNNIYDINSDLCKKAGLGEKATFNLTHWLIDNKPLIDNLPINTESQSSTLVTSELTKVVCISGKLSSFPSKAKAKAFLAELGYSLTDNMSKKVDYLINEDKKESSKVKLARKYNIEILTIEELKGK